MLVVDNKSYDPYFNIACEEYLFRNFSEDILFLYINSPSIIVGKHQNAYEEVNLKYIKENKLPVIRRISGGGTVYHDEGNLNFTFIRNREYGRQISFIEHTRPIISFFEKHGLSPYVGDKNEIREDGLKFSGNAEHVFKNRVLHHGTILFSSELNNLRKALKKGNGRYISRAVKSNRTTVGNLSSKLKDFSCTEDLKNALQIHIISESGKAEIYTISDFDREAVTDLLTEKYSRDEWNYGYGPEYKFRNNFEYNGARISINFEVKGGIITDCSITGESSWEALAREMVGKEHVLDDVRKLVLHNFPDAPDMLIYSFFN